MAVSEQTPYIEYTANGTTTSFALNFDCNNQDHLIVLVDDIEPVVGTWSLSSGAVVFNTAPENGKKITIQRNTPFSRTTDYQSYNNSFRPPAINKDFDWIWLKLQELGVADWILANRIDALKNYVDDRDDELRAYLIEEIRKQGVALDQLDDYYNYLMQRLAQIAVQGGWDASFVVDASGKSQQQLTSFKPNFLNDTAAMPGMDVTAILNAWTKNADDNQVSSLEIPMNGFNYTLSDAVVIQEPTAIVGDKGATYDRGLGKKGWFLLGSAATHAFDLGNYRTYEAGVYDPENNISPNNADYWTVKNIGIKPSDDVTPQTQDGIRLTTQTNGPDRALQVNEVSLKRLDKAIYVAEMQGDSIVTVASLNVSDSVINLCNHGVFVEGRSFQSCIENNQIEQNSIASVWGAFDGTTRIINNIIEGAQQHGIVFTVPTDQWGSQNQAIVESQYFEGLTENCIQIDARNGSAYWLRGNKNYGIATKDYCLIKKGSRTNIYNAELERFTIEDGVALNLNSELTKNSNYSLYFRPTVAAFSPSSFMHRFGQLKSPDTSYIRFMPPFTRKITKVYDQLAYANEAGQSMASSLTVNAGDLLELNVLVKCSDAGSANTALNVANSGGQLIASIQLRMAMGEYAVATVLTRALISSTGTAYATVPSTDATDLEIFGVAVKNHGPVTIGNRYLISPCQPTLHTIAGKHAQKYDYAGVTVPANSSRTFDLVLASVFGEVGNLVQAALSVYVARIEVSAVVRAGGVVQVTLRNTTAADIAVPACQVRAIVL